MQSQSQQSQQSQQNEQYQQNEQSDKQHEIQDSSFVQIDNEKVNVTHKDSENDENLINVNYKDFNLHVTHQFLKRDHEFKCCML
jgi:translation initiation factor 2B subunit (eIF-2B alpha/beta/delta family)